jgi:hypothetical protein
MTTSPSGSEAYGTGLQEEFVKVWKYRQQKTLECCNRRGE